MSGRSVPPDDQPSSEEAMALLWPYDVMVAGGNGRVHRIRRRWLNPSVHTVLVDLVPSREMETMSERSGENPLFQWSVICHLIQALGETATLLSQHGIDDESLRMIVSNHGPRRQNILEAFLR